MDHNNSILNWFSIPIYSKKLDTDNYNNALAAKAIDLKSNLVVSANDWRCSTFSTLNQYDWKSDNDPIVSLLIEKCRNEVHEFALRYGINKPITDLICDDFWFNVAEKNDYQEYHQHPNSHFSLSYYVRTPEKCGNIVFKSFESMFDMNSLPIQDDNLNQYSFKTCSYTPSQSTIIIFRSHIPHMVEQNLSDDLRIGVTMNFSYTR